MKHKLQTMLKHKLQWLVLLAALLGVSHGVWGDNTVVSDGTYRLYFQFSEGSDWWNNNGCYHYAWVWHNGDAGIHKRIYKVGTTNSASTGNKTDYFYLELPTASNKAIDRIKLFRGKSSTNPADGLTTEIDDSFNKTGDVEISNDISSYNLITAVTENGTSCTQNSNYAIDPSSCSVEITGAQSGTGTQGDPYIVNVGEQYTLTLSAACDDGNLTKYYTFDNSNWSTTATKNVTPAAAGTTTYSNMKAKMGNGSGTVTYSNAVSASTIYVQAVAACTSPSITSDLSGSTTWTKCGNAADRELSITASGGSGTLTYQWFRNTTNTLTDGVADLTGATAVTDMVEGGNTYSPSASDYGVFYYCCVVRSGGACSANKATSVYTGAIEIKQTPTVKPSTITVKQYEPVKLNATNSSVNWSITAHPDGAAADEYYLYDDTKSSAMFKGKTGSTGSYTITATSTGSDCTSTSTVTVEDDPSEGC